MKSKFQSNMEKENFRENLNVRSKEIVSIRMKTNIKYELDCICEELDITRNNFILNSVIKEIKKIRANEIEEHKKKIFSLAPFVS